MQIEKNLKISNYSHFLVDFCTHCVYNNTCKGHENPE
nr:MAG TPA: hypothetical protein [Bacteriophage sp.]